MNENFVLQTHHFLEFFVNPEQFENTDQSVIISVDEKVNSAFFVISKLDEYLNIDQSMNKLNSHIVNLDMKEKVKKNIQITFRHLVRENIVKINTKVYFI